MHANSVSVIRSVWYGALVVDLQVWSPPLTYIVFVSHYTHFPVWSQSGAMLNLRDMLGMSGTLPM